MIEPPVGTTWDTRYTVPVPGSYTGVPSTPTSGMSTLHPVAVVIGHGVPSCRDHSIAPLAWFSPYTQSFVVATMSVFPATTGWA